MNRVFLLLPLFLLACETSQQQGARPGHPSENHVPGRLDFGAFTLKTPKEWTKFTEQGIDSYVGGLTNGKDTLEFDYGWWSHMIENYDDPSSVFAADTLDG